MKENFDSKGTVLQAWKTLSHFSEAPVFINEIVSPLSCLERHTVLTALMNIKNIVGSRIVFPPISVWT